MRFLCHGMGRAGMKQLHLSIHMHSFHVVKGVVVVHWHVLHLQLQSSPTSVDPWLCASVMYTILAVIFLLFMVL
jgi:hypothetical protein